MLQQQDTEIILLDPMDHHLQHPSDLIRGLVTLNLLATTTLLRPRLLCLNKNTMIVCLHLTCHQDHPCHLRWE